MASSESVVTQFHDAVSSVMKTSGIGSKWSLANQLNVSKYALTKWFSGETSASALSAGEVACHWYLVETRRGREENLNRWREEVLKLKSRISSLVVDDTSSAREFEIRPYGSSFTDSDSRMYNRVKKKYENAGQHHIRVSIQTVRRREALSRMQRNANAWNIFHKSRFHILDEYSSSNQKKVVQYREIPRKLSLKLGVTEDAAPGSIVKFAYNGVEYSAKIPDHHIQGNKTINVTITTYEKQAVVPEKNKNRRRRGVKKESMWHALNSETDTENHPYWLGRKVRRYFFSPSCEKSNDNIMFCSEIGVVTGVRMIPLVSSNSETDRLFSSDVVDTSNWRVADVSTWLREKCLRGHEHVDHVIRIFKEHSVDGDLLKTMTLKDMRLMGLNEFLDLATRRRVLFSMLKLRGVAPRWRVRYKHILVLIT